jgi:hypothetical protein
MEPTDAMAKQYLQAFVRELATPTAICVMAVRLYTPLVSSVTVRVYSEDREPDITLNHFLQRIIVTFQHLSPSVILITVLLVSRLISKHSHLQINNTNCLRMILVAIVTAAKLNEDMTYTNNDYAKASEYLPLVELNRLERQFLSYVEFDTLVTAPQLAIFLENQMRVTTFSDRAEY